MAGAGSGDGSSNVSGSGVGSGSAAGALRGKHSDKENVSQNTNAGRGEDPAIKLRKTIYLKRIWGAFSWQQQAITHLDTETIQTCHLKICCHQHTYSLVFKAPLN